jgi:hypothetical protein
MKWLRVGLTIFDAIARSVDSIGPVSFEPIEKHPEPRPPAGTTDPKADYSTTADGEEETPGVAQ